MNLNEIFEQVDQLYREKKGEAAERLMRKYISQAIKDEDDTSLLQLMNELLGYYRETSQVENSFIIADQAIALTKKMGLEGTLPYATTLLNVANAYRAGGRLEESLQRYNQVQKIYGQKLAPDNMLMASLQNNLSLLYQEMGDFRSAKECLLRALPVVQAKKADFEVAVTYANLANTCMSLDEMDEANVYATEAIKGYDALGVKDSHYGAALSAQGTFYYKKGEYETAIGIFKEAMEIIEVRLGKNEYYYRLQDNIATCEEEIEKERQAKELKARMEEQARAEQAAKEAEERAAAEQAAREAEERAAAERAALEEEEELELQVEMERYLARYLEPQNAETQQKEQVPEQKEPEIFVPVQNPFETEISSVEYESAKSGQEVLMPEEAEAVEEVEQEVFVSEEDEDEDKENLEFENTEDDFEDEEELEDFESERDEFEDEEREVGEEVFEFENDEDDFEDEEVEDLTEEQQETTEESQRGESRIKPESAAVEYEPEIVDIYVSDRSTDGVKGLELCREYYETYGKQMLEEKFPFYINKIAVGLVGPGSDCFGYDDEISRDHDWGPDFCMWVTDATYLEIGAALQEAYNQLPRDFKGYQRTYSEQGQGRRGVRRISDFYRELLQASTYEGIDWRNVSDASLAASVNGEVFRDTEGVFTEFRNKLLQGYPEHIKQLKIADSMARFSQAGQYNFARVLKRGDVLTAQIMLADCMREAMKLQHYIEGTYPPHDKWLYCSIHGTEEGKTLAHALMKLQMDLQKCMVAHGSLHEDCVNVLNDDIESIASFFSSEMYVNNVISDSETYLDEHTDELVQKATMTTMTDEELIDKIIELEFEAFDKVKNEGGRASCQDDWNTFSIMRKSQYLTWNREMLQQYLYDFEREWKNGHNLIEEKYGRMMESTAPEEYEQIKDHFPVISPEKKAIIEEIVPIQVAWMQDFSKQYPYLAYNARSIGSGSDSADNTSFETYLRGEISTYSDKMLELYGRFVVEYFRENKNLTLDIMQNSVRLYGYGTLESAESFMKYQNF